MLNPLLKETQDFKVYQSFFKNFNESGFDKEKEIVSFKQNIKKLGVDFQDSETGNTALHMACQYKNLEIIVLLVKEQQANVNLKNKADISPLYTSIKNSCDIEIIKLLLEAGAAVNEQNDEKEETVLHLLCYEYYYPDNERNEIIQLLTQYKVDSSLKNIDGDTPLHFECRSFNNDEVVKILLASKGEINEKNNFGNTPLYIACENKISIPFIRFLISNGADISIKSNNKNYILDVINKNYFRSKNILIFDWLNHYLMKFDNNKIEERQQAAYFRNLLTIVGGFSAEEPGTACNIFHLACKYGNYQLVVWCIGENSSIVNVKTKDGISPLYICISNGHYGLIEKLLNSKANINEVNGNLQDTALHLACHQWQQAIDDSSKNKIEKIIELLIRNGADYSVKNKEDKSSLEIIGNAKNINGFIFLLYEIYFLNKDINRKHEQNISKFAQSLAHIEDINIKNAHKKTLLHLACENKNIELIKILIDMGININSQDENGDTSLHIACELRHIEIVSYLIKKGADTTILNKYSMAPFEYEFINIDKYKEYIKSYGASDEKKLAIELELKNFGINNIFDFREQNTFLHFACICNNSKLVEFLVTNGADFNLQNADGNTPLHIAYIVKNDEIINILLKSNPNIEIKNKEGKSPLSIKKDNEEKEKIFESCCEYFLNHSESNSNTESKDEKELEGFRDKEKEIDEFQELIKSANDINLEKDKTTILHLACKYQNIYVVEFLIKQGANVNPQNSEGNTPLHIACQLNNIILVGLLINSGANPNIKNKNDKTPGELITKNSNEITAALKANFFELYRKLLKKDGNSEFESFAEIIKKQGINAVEPEKGDAILHIACKEKNIGVVKFLLNQKEINVNLQNANGNTPLHIACTLQNFELVCILIDKGANLNLTNNFSKSPLLIACSNISGDIGFQIIEFLLNKNANPHLKDYKGNIFLHLLCGLPEKYAAKAQEIISNLLNKNLDLINYKNQARKTPLHIACESKNISIIDLLIKFGADLEAKNASDKTPLQENAEIFSEYDRYIFNIGNLIVRDNSEELKKQINTFLEKVNKHGVNYINFQTKNTVLHLACKNGNVEIIQKLINLKANVELHNDDEGTPLHIACKSKSINIIKMLIKTGANINTQNKFGQTPLYLTCVNSLGKDTVEVIKFLLDLNANVSLKDSNGNTILHRICESDYISLEYPKKIIQMLLKNNLNLINVSNNNQDTPLQIACKLQKNEIVDFLINLGANFDFLKTVKSNINENSNVNETHIENYLLFYQAYNDEIFISYESSLKKPIAKSEIEKSEFGKDVLERGINLIHLKTGSTFLHLACQHGNSHVVTFLLKLGANVNCKDYLDNTPLHIAYQLNKNDLIKILKGAKADMTIKNKDGKSASDLERELSKSNPNKQRFNFNFDTSGVLDKISRSDDYNDNNDKNTP